MPIQLKAVLNQHDANSDSEDEESSRGDIIPEMPKLSNCEDEAIVLRNVKPEIPELSISEDEASSSRNANSETREIPETENEATDLAPSIRFGRKHSKVEAKGTKVRKTAQEYYERTDEERAQAAREARIADAENNAPDRTSHPKLNMDLIVPKLRSWAQRVRRLLGSSTRQQMRRLQKLQRSVEE
jgi:hypothetical protein